MFGAAILISFMGFMCSWFLLMAFVIRLNKINPAEGRKHKTAWIIIGSTSDDMNLISYIEKKDHKKYKDAILNTLGALILILYYPSLILVILTAFAFVVYRGFF